MNLQEQFAQEYVGKDPDKDFKKKFLPALRDVLTVYPQAKVEKVTGEITLPFPASHPIQGSKKIGPYGPFLFRVNAAPLFE
jgi:hypothetical protein